jgi:hypothetical protein
MVRLRIGNAPQNMAIVCHVAMTPALKGPAHHNVQEQAKESLMGR